MYSSWQQVEKQILGHLGSRYTLFVIMSDANRAYIKYYVKHQKMPRLDDGAGLLEGLDRHFTLFFLKAESLVHILSGRMF